MKYIIEELLKHFREEVIWKAIVLKVLLEEREFCVDIGPVGTELVSTVNQGLYCIQFEFKMNGREEVDRETRKGGFPIYGGGKTIGSSCYKGV